MSTLTHRSHSATTPGLSDFAGRAVETASRSHASLMSRIKDFFVERRRRRTDSVVAQLVQSHGGVMSDDLEREISRRLGAMAGRY
jgi:hypothetical protein